MDLKTELTASWAQFKRFNTLYQDKVREGVSVCLVVYLAYVCAQLALGVFTNNSQSQTVAMANANTLKSNTENVRAYHNLFGQFQRAQPRKKNYQKVKLTPLNLTLVGTVFKAKNALAIIKNGKAKAKVYRQGDKIISGVLLKDVAKNYVVIERGGKLEKILIKFNYIRPNGQPKRKTIDLGKSKRKAPSTGNLSGTQKRKLSNYLKEVSSKPEGLLTLISIAPNFSNGKLTGFKLNSSKEKQLFNDLGFKENDTVTRINNTILDDFSASFKVVKLLKKTNFFDIYLDRHGEQHIITLDLN
ncbi:MAG: type II secretion system protein N [Gammaproteobacteria bacterium]|nr:type II secretion system protein N [Gammaproteobacteria bacterium]